MNFQYGMIWTNMGKYGNARPVMSVMEQVYDLGDPGSTQRTALGDTGPSGGGGTEAAWPTQRNALGDTGPGGGRDSHFFSGTTVMGLL